MKPALAFLELHIPAFVKKKMLADLFDLTAQAFGSVPPRINILSYGETLEVYARFTQREAERVLEERHNIETVEARLYDNARALGKKLRESFRLRRPEDILRMSKLLYKTLGIAFEGRGDGQVTIARCYFSQFYTERVCGLVSALDAGVAAGLSGGGKLSFYQKITEGRDCCKAHFVLKGD
jgi:hypothetical protein